MPPRKNRSLPRLLPSNRDPLNIYDKRISRCRITFQCHTCEETMLSRTYINHSKLCLQLDPLIQCIWCYGKVSWSRRSKYQHVNHLLKCWDKFIKQCSSDKQPQKSVEGFVLDDSKLMCPEKNFFGRDIMAATFPPNAYEFILPIELESPVLPFQNAGVNQAVACIQKYIALRDTWEFFHCMVRAVAFTSFLAAMEDDRGRSRVLPFSCLCDGGSELEAKHRQHRHLIIASPGKDRFQQAVWKKISVLPKDKPYKGFKCILKKPIESPMHLTNTMGYLSKRESRCDGTFHDWEKHCDSPPISSSTPQHSQPFTTTTTTTTSSSSESAARKLNHFWIFTPLPPNFRLPVVLQWDNGILELIHQDYRYLKPKLIARAGVQKIRGRFEIAVKDIPGIKLFLVLPVAKNFKPIRKEDVGGGGGGGGETSTEYFLHLNRGRKLYFEKDDSLSTLNDQAWGQMQADLGNMFYAAISDELWTPSIFQQKCLHNIEPFLLEIAALKKQLAELNEEKKIMMRIQNESLEKKENRALEQKKHADDISLQNKELLEQKRILQHKYDKAMQKIRLLKLENYNNKKSNNEKDRLNHFLTVGYLQAQASEIKRLKKNIEEMKKIKES